jgi:hypothetical protein
MIKLFSCMEIRIEENQTNKKSLDPQEVILKLKKLIESLKNKPNSVKNGNELKTAHTPEN